MAHRIREAMKETNPGPLGGEGKTVEADETYIGNLKKSRHRHKFKNGIGWMSRGGQQQFKAVSLVERGGKARSVHVPSITANRVSDVLVRNANRKSDLRTDEANVYKGVGREFNSHQSVNHSAKELADHRRFTLATDIDVYFCDPLSLWQRGSKENTNRLLRQYFPKGADLSVHSQAHLNKIARQ